ncbi:MAG: tetratricopeptide repeat protein [Lachnospiraceae bacterium]|nr:tetratricopeptide repeat protein [Lachnospiraceae bacterium]
MNEKEAKRIKEREKERARRRKRRRRIVLLEKIIVAAVFVVILAGAGILLYNLLPGIKLEKQLEEANAYMEAESYDEAIASCEEALKIDSSSVQAYRAMAGVYLTKEDVSSAEQVLYQGWETTKDEGLLQYYCTVLLNEAVADIKNQDCTYETVSKCIAVLEMDPHNADAFERLDVCYAKMFLEEGSQENPLCHTQTGNCSFTSYQNMMLQMIADYNLSPTEELKTEILKFAIPGNEMIWIDLEHLKEYQELLSKISQVGESDEITQLMNCMAKASDMQDFFGEAFAIFESGEYEPIKEFMNGERYLSIRDEFMDGTMEYWMGETYIPVSREKMKFIKEDGSWKFAFANYEECNNASNVVNVWSAKQEDAGVQRVCISYEPAAADGEYYPHTTYEFIYLYSNVDMGRENYVPQMNYRFETRVATPEGTTTQLVGDWGGEHEWTTEF